MKTPGGSRDDSASSPSADAGEDDRDDPKLQAMRQVWLAMREQAPPDGGMAELLAAARAKAAIMQPRPSPWRRWLASLRRPPAFAFATVIVLIGGAVVVTRGGDHAPSARRTERATSVAQGIANEDPAPVPPASAARGPARSPGDAEADATAARRERDAALAPSTIGSSAPSSANARAGTPARLAPAPVAVAVPQTGATTRGGAAAPAPNRAAAPSARVVDSKDRLPGDDVKRSADPPRERPARSPEPATVPTPGLLRERADEPGNLDAASGPVDEPAETMDVSGETGKTEGKTAPPAPRGREGSTLAPLYRQCEAAAARGDCATVRRLVVQITTKDRGYRARIAKDSAVARCLAGAAR